MVRFETDAQKLEEEKNEARKHQFTYNLKKFYIYMDPYSDQGNFAVKRYDKMRDDSIKKIISF